MRAILSAANDEPEPLDLRQARQRAEAAQKRLSRYVRALDAGMDPELVVRQTREAQIELAAAKAVIASHRGHERTLDEGALRALLSEGGTLGGLLEVATPEERRQIYSHRESSSTT